MPDDQNNRITELEIGLAHVQRLYEQLNEVVTDQSSELTELRRANKTLNDKIERLKSDGSDTPADLMDDKPPHY